AGRGDGLALAAGVGVRERSLEALAPEDDHEAVFLAGLDDDLHVTDPADPAEDVAELDALFRGNAAGAAVRDEAGAVEGTEVAADGDVAALEGESQAERLDHPAAHLVPEGIVPEEAEVAGAAARRDAGRDGNHAALRGIPGERVKVRGACGLERGEIALVPSGQIAKAVHDEEGELGAGPDLETRVNVIDEIGR